MIFIDIVYFIAKAKKNIPNLPPAIVGDFFMNLQKVADSLSMMYKIGAGLSVYLVYPFHDNLHRILVECFFVFAIEVGTAEKAFLEQVV